MRVHDSAFAAAKRWNFRGRYLQAVSRASRSMRPAEAAVARNFNRTLCVTLVMALLAASSPTAVPTVVGAVKGAERSAVSWLRTNALSAKLYRGVAYSYFRYRSLSTSVDSGSTRSPGETPGAAAVAALVSPAPVVLNAPTNIAVTSTTNTLINLSWTAPTGTVAHYRVERSQSSAGPFLVIANAPTTNHQDSTVSDGIAYLYRIRAVDGSGMPSPPSTMVLGTAISFADPTLYAGTTPIRKQHIYDLRQSVDAVRILAGIGAFAWTHPDLTELGVQALHIQQLRDKLGDALGLLNIPVAVYDDSSLAIGANGTFIKKKHIEELRERSTSGSSTSTGPAFSDGDISIARLDPMNRTGGAGEDPLSRNFNWSVSLVGLPGRSGLDLGLSLSYNSLVWTKSGSFISFDDDQGFPGPGFRLGFPVIQSSYFNSEVGKNAFLLITSNGERVELRRVGTSAFYEAADSSHLQLDASTSTMILRSTDGTQLTYEWKGSDYQCTKIKDRNGNFITVTYTAFGRIDTVVDTLSRTIQFNYIGTTLDKITQTWTVNGSPQTHTWASFTYNNALAIQTNFSSVTNLGPQNGSTLKVLTRVTFADSSRFDFDYTSWGQVWKVSNSATDGHLLNYRSYNLRGSPLLPTGTEDDCPRFTERYDWAKNWNRNGSGVEQDAITKFAVPVSTSWTVPNAPSQAGMVAEVTLPLPLENLTYHKIYYPSSIAGTSTGWHRGLSSMVETFDSVGLQRRSVTTWAQDTAASYPLNPRVVETNVYDGSGGNRRRVTTSYASFALPSGSSCQLPSGTQEYAADATTFLRRTETDYRMHPTADADYLNRHIIGLVKEQRLYGIDAGVETLMSKVGFAYDETAIQGTIAPVKHDNADYGTSFVVGRANLTKVTRYDVSNTSLFVETSNKYNRAGAVVEKRDPATHTTTISYADAFAAEGEPADPALSFTTLAYPTMVTDADGYSSSVRYNYDIGAPTWRQTPMPNTTGNTPGPKQKTKYDTVGRVQRITNLVNNAYTQFNYGPNYVESFASVNNVADEAHAVDVFDGAGRVIAKASNHPNSSGGFSGQLVHYDAMGRAVKQSNPTETSITISIPRVPILPYGWEPTGDDAPPAGNGWVYTQQSYDWKGRPRITTNPSVTGNPADTTTSEAVYNGCGCAGGEEVTLTDEGTIDGGVAKRREQKIYSDVLGRTVKTETFNWEGGTVYSTVVNTYNARDQLTLVRQYQGSDQSSVYQDTTLDYDGHGRLQHRHLPEQQLDSNNSASTDRTTWDYNPDDTIQRVTDARGAITNYGYNNRHLVNSITYTLLPGVPTTGPSGVASAAATTYDYDAAGNRTSMVDGQGNVSYSYDQLSRLETETRHVSALSNSITSGNYTLSYEYNFAGALTRITDPFAAQVSYNFDLANRVENVTGSGFAGDSTYALDIRYRAWGGQKSVTYGDDKSGTTSYDARMRPSAYDFPGLREQFNYYNDGRLKQMTDLDDRNQEIGYPDTARHFSRARTYDQLGRLTSDKGATSSTFPFNQSYSYDAFDNMNSRWGTYYYQTPTSDSGGYSNNRRQHSSYHADGQVKHSPLAFDYNLNESVYRDWSYDAAGRMIQVQETIVSPSSTSTYTTSYDGDGQPVGESTVTASNNTTGYVIRSSVLGGQVLTRLDSAGAKQKTTFNVDGRLVVVQLSFSGSNWVSWTHIDPLGMSEAGDTKPVYDPMGNYIPWQHVPTAPPNVYPPFSSNFGGLGSAFGSSQDRSCVFNDRPILCSELAHQMDIGNVSALLHLGGSAIEVPLVPFGLGVYQVFVPNADGRKLGAPPPDDDVVRVNHNADDRRGHYVVFLLSVAPQTPQNPQPSAKGFPCPPSVAEIFTGRDQSTVGGVLTATWNLARENNREEGGWIYMNKKGRLRAVQKNRDAEPSTLDRQAAIDLNYPKSMKGWVVIADFHTHDFGNDPSESVPGFVTGDVDINNYIHRVPGIILGGTKLDAQGFNGYGPKRGYWMSDLPKRCQ